MWIWDSSLTIRIDSQVYRIFLFDAVHNHTCTCALFTKCTCYVCVYNYAHVELLYSTVTRYTSAGMMTYFWQSSLYFTISIIACTKCIKFILLYVVYHTWAVAVHGCVFCTSTSQEWVTCIGRSLFDDDCLFLCHCI